MGSGRSGAGFQSEWARRGTSLRSALPSARRSSGVWWSHGCVVLMAALLQDMAAPLEVGHPCIVERIPKPGRAETARPGKRTREASASSTRTLAWRRLRRLRGRGRGAGVRLPGRRLLHLAARQEAAHHESEQSEHADGDQRVLQALVARRLIELYELVCERAGFVLADQVGAHLRVADRL